ncbi:MAG: hypothetical protein KatS3mg119_2330 [Rhodothalassiaceae bacterium]|nr:MAG: hypothetical protein KatS3mg119_2330 [Rhodothalassiaceae bacterium]
MFRSFGRTGRKVAAMSAWRVAVMVLAATAAFAFASGHVRFAGAQPVVAPGKRLAFHFAGEQAGVDVYTLQLDRPPATLRLLRAGTGNGVLVVTLLDTGRSAILALPLARQAETGDAGVLADSGSKSRVTVQFLMQTPQGGYVYAVFEDDKLIGFLVIQPDGQVQYIPKGG